MDHDPRNPTYIISQGPMTNTVADFWQMVWEQGSVVIVMLSKYVGPFVTIWIVLKYSPPPRLTENGYQLCHRYWPEEGSEQYHIFEVSVTSALSHLGAWKCSNVIKFSIAGPPGVWARVVRGLPGQVPLPQEQPDGGDQDRDSVPLPLLARRQHPHLHQVHPGVQTVSADITELKLFNWCCCWCCIQLINSKNWLRQVYFGH